MKNNGFALGPPYTFKLPSKQPRVINTEIWSWRSKLSHLLHLHTFTPLGIMLYFLKPHFSMYLA